MVTGGEGAGRWLSLAAGSLLGGFARYFLGRAVYSRLGTEFPYGTLAVNLSGCFLIGVFYVWLEEKLMLGESGRMLLVTGFCGAYTTFSTFMLETSALAQSGQLLWALANVAISATAGFLLLRAGMALARLF